MLTILIAGLGTALLLDATTETRINANFRAATQAFYVAKAGLEEARADKTLVFSPFWESPREPHPGVEVLAGKKLISWFSALDTQRPPTPGTLGPGQCDCGSLLEERVNRAGKPLLVCSRYPSCRGMRNPILSLKPVRKRARRAGKLRLREAHSFCAGSARLSPIRR